MDQAATSVFGAHLRVRNRRRHRLDACMVRRERPFGGADFPRTAPV